MSLAGRLTAFFLGALALVLVACGATLYTLTAAYLGRQTDARLTAALDTLEAAAEVHADGVEWEGSRRQLTLGDEAGDEQVRWTVCDPDGHPVARSPNFGGACLADDAEWSTRSRVVTSSPSAPPDPDDARGTPDDVRYPALKLTAALSPRPAQATLRRLALALAAVGAAAWLLVAVPGWRLCRRALAPLHRMAGSARAMGAADLSRRLAPAGTGDELDELGAAFNGLLGRLEEAFERQRRFTGDAAHQLSTPLTVLLGHLEVALRRERPAGDYRAALAEAQGQAVRLRKIVELLLFLARPEADALPPDQEEVDLAGWLPAHLARWDSHPRRADLRLEVAPGAPVRAAVAPALLGQLLDNLLDNACKYSPPGAPVTLRLRAAPGGAVIEVEDAGVGIAADDLPHVFEPFYRSPEARRLGKPGVGLGLAVARRLAAAQGGTLDAASEPGRGSRFTLRLPAVPA